VCDAKALNLSRDCQTLEPARRGSPCDCVEVKVKNARSTTTMPVSKLWPSPEHSPALYYQHAEYLRHFHQPSQHSTTTQKHPLSNHSISTNVALQYLEKDRDGGGLHISVTSTATGSPNHTIFDEALPNHTCKSRLQENLIHTARIQISNSCA
jgi:hypothetical protein